MAYSFEKMTYQHRKEVIDIFNFYIENTMAAYPDEPVGYEFFDLFLNLSEGFPSLVIKDTTGNIVGFAFMRPFLPVKTMRRTAEITYFLLPDHTRKGLGTAIVNRFVGEAASSGIDTILANISSRNEASVRFHQKCGFKECGRFRRVGKKCNDDFDVIWMQLLL
ncbi:MAG: N-acetyltransferase family protein [Deltaproteobacteria bacterium]|nr:N-acetyltransferase family protein [Deltaproteobacteria bacterium]